MNRRALFALVLCSLAFAACDASELTVGLHTVSVHVPEREHHNNDNFGVYVQAGNVIGGAYRNSIGRTTIYGAYVQPLGRGFDVMPGLAYGYQRKCTDVIVQTGRFTKVEKREDGSTVTTSGPVLEHKDQCSGFSRGAITPALAFSYTAPHTFLGATPRVWVVIGGHKSSTVGHATLQWRARFL